MLCCHGVAFDEDIQAFSLRQSCGPCRSRPEKPALQSVPGSRLTQHLSVSSASHHGAHTSNVCGLLYCHQDIPPALTTRIQKESLYIVAYINHDFR